MLVSDCDHSSVAAVVVGLNAGDDPPKGIDPAWEEVYYFDTEAINEEQAKEKMLHQYPTAQGFVIEGVEKYLSS